MEARTEKDFIDYFVRVGELRKKIEQLDDDDWITVCLPYILNDKLEYFKISYLKDSTCFGFWELRCG